jgi:hypothetical protein
MWNERATSDDGTDSISNLQAMAEENQRLNQN